MTAYSIKQLKDSKNGNPFFPKTHTKCVVDDNGYSVESLIDSKVSPATLAGYTPTANFATINGSNITGGGNVIITAGDSSITTIDATPTSGSTNPVQSGGVYDALDGGFYYVNS